jgi:hypothetical protein
MKKGPGRPTKNESEPSIYIPHEEFVGYMKRLLQLFATKREITDDMIAGGKITDVERKQKEYRKEYNDVHRLKDYYLKRIFQSMADLTFFFNAISTYPDLYNEFDDEIKDLLGIKRVNPRGDNYAFMFMSLVAGMISVNRIDDDFRLRLTQRLQDLIWFKISGLKILDTPRSTGMIFDDIGRAQAWIEMVASRVKDEYDWDIITQGIKGLTKEKYGGTETERQKAFEQDVFQKRPARTFTFDTEELFKN